MKHGTQKGLSNWPLERVELEKLPRTAERGLKLVESDASKSSSVGHTRLLEAPGLQSSKWPGSARFWQAIGKFKSLICLQSRWHCWNFESVFSMLFDPYLEEMCENCPFTWARILTVHHGSKYDWGLTTGLISSMVQCPNSDFIGWTPLLVWHYTSVDWQLWSDTFI